MKDLTGYVDEPPKKAETIDHGTQTIVYDEPKVLAEAMNQTSDKLLLDYDKGDQTRLEDTGF